VHGRMAVVLIGMFVFSWLLLKGRTQNPFNSQARAIFNRQTSRARSTLALPLSILK
jgi:hypothetical protein